MQILADAEDAMLEQAQFIAADKPTAASAWPERIWDAIETLEHFPARHAVSRPESDALGVEIRKLAVGNYLIFYRIDEGRRHSQGLARRVAQATHMQRGFANCLWRSP